MRSNGKNWGFPRKNRQKNAASPARRSTPLKIINMIHLFSHPLPHSQKDSLFHSGHLHLGNSKYLPHFRLSLI